METKDLVYGIGIALTFILGVWNLVNTYFQTRKASFINTVTRQRIEWLEKVRQDVSRFCGLTHTWAVSGLEGKPEEFEVHSDRIPELTHESRHEELKEAIRELVNQTQAMLKAEWDKVKLESEKGNLGKKKRT